jgi:DNA-binding TFAR19-related protein (PDSD5 family)
MSLEPTANNLWIRLGTDFAERELGHQIELILASCAELGRLKDVRTERKLKSMPKSTTFWDKVFSDTQ